MRVGYALFYLASYRSEAIEHAFGDLSAALPDQVRIEFVRSRDPEAPLPRGAIAYDPEQRVLFISRSFLGASSPKSAELGCQLLAVL